jgi:exodeoxyribonuclease-3
VEIDGFDNLMEAGFVDTFRMKYPEEVKYSWWNYRFNSRENNVGWRIDYFLVSEDFTSAIADAEIHNDRFGSDHCPVSIKLAL